MTQLRVPRLDSKPNSWSAIVTPGRKLAVIRAQQVRVPDSDDSSRRAAILGLGAAIFPTGISTSSVNAGAIEEHLEKNKELNDKKRLATSGANFARAYTVQFGTRKFPEDFTGCQDLAKQKKVPFLSDDLELECEGKYKYTCGSIVFRKWCSNVKSEYLFLHNVSTFQLINIILDS